MEGFNFSFGRGGHGNVDNSANRFIWFFQIYFRKFWGLIKLNLVYLLFCMPIVTIGPATAAMVKIIKCYIIEQPVYVFSDFVTEFKKNFKSMFLIGIFNVIFVVSVAVGVYLYFKSDSISWIVAALFVMAILVVSFMLFYIYVMTVCVDLSMSQLITNSFILSLAEFPTNFLTFIILMIIILPVIVLVPLSISVVPFFTFSLSAFVVTFNIYPIIRKHIIKPYYEQQKKEIPQDRVFVDQEQKKANKDVNNNQKNDN